MSGSERVNTRLSGSARVDSMNMLPSGEIRGQTKLIKITKDVRRYAAKERISGVNFFWGAQAASLLVSPASRNQLKDN